MVGTRVVGGLVVALAVTAVLFSGCLSADGTATPTISSENASEKALSAEESYISGQFANATCLGPHGTGGVGNERAEITNRTSQGVYVHLDHPYHYREGKLEVDAETTALYFVNRTATVRVNGSSVSPC